jgi:hypothetical protein
MVGSRSPDSEPALTYLVLALAFVVPLLVLGLVALLRARPEDIPAIIRALARWGRR